MLCCAAILFLLPLQTPVCLPVCLCTLPCSSSSCVGIAEVLYAALTQSLQLHTPEVQKIQRADTPPSRCQWLWRMTPMKGGRRSLSMLKPQMWSLVFHGRRKCINISTSHQYFYKKNLLWKLDNNKNNKFNL